MLQIHCLGFRIDPFYPECKATLTLENKDEMAMLHSRQCWNTYIEKDTESFFYDKTYEGVTFNSDEEDYNDLWDPP